MPLEAEAVEAPLASPAVRPSSTESPAPSRTESAPGTPINAKFFQRNLRVPAGWNRRKADIADRRWTSESLAVQLSPRNGKIPLEAALRQTLCQRLRLGDFGHFQRRRKAFEGGHEHGALPVAGRLIQAWRARAPRGVRSCARPAGSQRRRRFGKVWSAPWQSMIVRKIRNLILGAKMTIFPNGRRLVLSIRTG